MKTICPHCGETFDTDNVYNPNDPIQRRGYDDQVWNETEGKPGTFRKNEYPEGSSEYYRWNRGARFQMNRER